MSAAAPFFAARDEGAEQVNGISIDPTTIVGRCYFPIVNERTKKVFLGAVYFATRAPDGVTAWKNIAERAQRAPYIIDARLTNEADKIAAVLSAIKYLPTPPAQTFVFVHTPGEAKFGGSSLGVATYLAGRLGVTNFVATGFLIDALDGSLGEMRLMPIDFAEHKVAAAPFQIEGRSVPLILPFANVAELVDKGYDPDNILTMENWSTGKRQRDEPINVIAPSTIGDLLFLLQFLGALGGGKK